MIDYSPAVSPDGRAIGFTRVVGPTTGDIYVRFLSADKTPGDERKITTDGRENFHPAWTTNGSNCDTALFRRWTKNGHRFGL